MKFSTRNIFVILEFLPKSWIGDTGNNKFYFLHEFKLRNYKIKVYGWMYIKMNKSIEIQVCRR